MEQAPQQLLAIKKSLEELDADIQTLFIKVQEVLTYLYAQQRFLDSGFDSVTDAIADRHMTGILANRPEFGVQGRFYFATDYGAKGAIFFDTGTLWRRIDADA